MTEPISGLITSISTLAKAGLNLANTTDATKRNLQLIEFQQAIIGLQSMVATVQAENSALVARMRDLEAELARIANWETEKQRYLLVSPWEGAHVYALKEAAKESEVPHWICPTCYQGRAKSILNFIDGKDGWAVLNCPVCKAQQSSAYRNGIPPQYGESYA